jgi:hypothetical protein
MGAAFSDAGSRLDAGPADLVLPVYIMRDASQVVVLPLRALRFVDVRVSEGGKCVGRFLGAARDPAGGCTPTDRETAFEPGGTVRAHVTLEDADEVPVAALAASLCAVVTGDGDGVQPTARCRRAHGAIAARGDWCSMTDAPATPQCADAFLVEARFAASEVGVND